MPYDPPLHDYRGIFKTRDFGHFCPFSWVITHDLWSHVDFDVVRPLVHDYRGICKAHDFDHFLPFLWVITHNLWSREGSDTL